ncbi:AraC family transcriptional regulator [Olivibacter sp. XZL3]|uniref:AraC family transcriptional regulator n=1 Tax=Olivibacter sp. XZL3 TaxID=1735116 RepID=UPI0010661620|nr:AraC family transcriptional regulator [Olivibacter sp. XZL3]
MIKKKEGFEGERAIILPPKIIEQYRSQLLTEAFYVTDIGFYPKARYHYRDRPSGADEHILIHCIEGKGTAQVDGHEIIVAPNDYLIIPAGKRHLYRADPDYPWTIYWVHFQGQQAGVICERLYDKMLSRKNSIMYNEKHLFLFNKIYNTLQQGYSRENMEFIALSFPYYLSGYLLNERFNHHLDEQAEDLTEQAIGFLKSRISTPTTLKDIAEHVHLSVSHFSSIFHKKTGYSPIEYFNHLKIQKACQLLQFTNQRIFEIALAIGINDPYYFSRLFRAHMGISPKNYRSRWSLSPQNKTDEP